MSKTDKRRQEQCNTKEYDRRFEKAFSKKVAKLGNASVRVATVGLKSCQ